MLSPHRVTPSTRLMAAGENVNQPRRGEQYRLFRLCGFPLHSPGIVAELGRQLAESIGLAVQVDALQSVGGRIEFPGGNAKLVDLRFRCVRKWSRGIGWRMEKFLG